VLSASLPGFADRGLVTRLRPKLEAQLGGHEAKATDFGVRPAAATESGEDAWCFDDVLTFTLTVEDLLGPGMRLRVQAHSDVQLGPLQLNLAGTRDLGECHVDVRSFVLPQCTLRNGPHWETSPLVLALPHVLGQVPGHVVVAFCVNEDPRMLLRVADWRTWSLTSKVGSHAAKWAEPCFVRDGKSSVYSPPEFSPQGGLAMLRCTAAR